MGLSRVLALAKKDLKRVFREPAFLFMIILFPVILTVAFGTSFGAVGGSQAPALRVGVVNLGGSSGSSSQFVSDLAATGALTVQFLQDNQTAQSDLSQGTFQAVILLPPNFDASVASFRSYPTTPARWVNSTLSLYLDKGSPLTAQVIPTMVEQVLRQGVLAVQPTAVAVPFTFATPSAVKVQGSSVFDSFAPGLFAFASIYMIMTVAQAYSGERENGVLRRIRMTPATDTDIVLGSVMSYLILGLFQALLVFGCVYALGYRPVAGPAGLVLGFVVITAFALCNIGFGLITAAIAKSPGAATGISFLFLMPQLFLGTFVGSALSSAAQSAGRFVPSYYVTDALTSLLTRGASVTSPVVLTDLSVVSVCSVAILLVGVQVFRRLGSR